MDIKNVAAFVCGMDEEYPYQIILGINKYARDHDINISYFAAFGGIIEDEAFDTGEYSIYQLPDLGNFDGALLLTNTFSNPTIRQAIIDKVKASKLPSVIFECRDHEEFHDVSIDNYAVMKRLVVHLIKEHGARVFNFISGPEGNPEASERYRAFRDALEENGIAFDEERRLFNGCFRSYDGIKAIEDFEKSGLTLPDAFVCANDSMALTAMNKLQNMGYKVPTDVIVTGFDNTFNAKNAYPALTTVRRPLYYSGQKACEVLRSLMNGKSQPRNIEMGAEPVFTQSCGCPAADIASILSFKRDMYLRLERTYTSVHMLNRLIAGLAGAENIEECVEHITDMLDTTDCDDFSLCLVKNWDNTYEDTANQENVDYPPLMTAPLIWDHGKRRSVERFPSRQLRPEPLTTGGNISYFIPLHFGQRILGYYIMTNTDFPIYSLQCHTITMSIGNAIESISKLNVLDPLCGIYNRNGFNLNAGYVFKDCVLARAPLTTIFVDMDDLKPINDTYGHKDGDIAIKSVAEAIVSSCGSIDICGRIGGDEFVVVGRGEDFSERFTTRFSEALARKNDELNKPYTLSASIGSVTKVPTASDTLFALIQQADERMYEAKKKKKAEKKAR